MKIENISAQKLFLGFLGNHGMPLPIGGHLIVADKYATHSSLRKMVDDGYVTISSFTVDDGYADSPFDEPQDFVSVAEFNSIIKGLYVIPDSWTSTGTPGASATGFILTGTAAGPFDLAQKNVLKFKFDDLNEVLVELEKGQYDIDTLFAKINADATFAMYGVAGKDGSGASLRALAHKAKDRGVELGQAIVGAPIELILAEGHLVARDPLFDDVRTPT